MIVSDIPNILLVMDGDGDESHAVHILAKYHFANSLLKVRNAKDALRYLSQFSSGPSSPPKDLPELIILSLSDTQKMEVIMASRRNSLATVPLVVVAGSREEEETIRTLNLPMTYCMTKPLGFFKLLEAMQKLGMFWIVLKASPFRT